MPKSGKSVLRPELPAPHIGLAGTIARWLSGPTRTLAAMSSLASAPTISHDPLARYPQLAEVTNTNFPSDRPACGELAPLSTLIPKPSGPFAQFPYEGELNANPSAFTTRSAWLSRRPRVWWSVIQQAPVTIGLAVEAQTRVPATA